MPDDWIGIDESTAIDKRVDAETVVFGTTTVYRERMQIAGVSSGAIAPVSSASGLLVDVSSNSSQTVNLAAGSTMTVSFTAGSTLTASLTAGSTVGVDLTTASIIRLDSSALTTGSKIRVETTAAWPVSSVTIQGGQSTVIQGAGLSSALSSQAWYMRLVDYGTTQGATINSSGELLISGTLSVTDSTGSTGAQKISGAGSTVQAVVNSSGELSVSVQNALPVSSVTIQGGQSTAIISTASAIRIDSTGALSVSGSSVGISSIAALRSSGISSNANDVVDLDVAGYGMAAAQITGDMTGASFSFWGTLDSSRFEALQAWPSSGGPAVSSVGASSGMWFIPTGGVDTIRVQLDSSGAGTSAHITLQAHVAGPLGNINIQNSTASPAPVLLQDSTATVTIQGNTTVALAAGSTLTASLTAGSTIGVDLTTASRVRIESTAALDVSAQTVTVTGTSNVAFTTASTASVIQGAGLTTAASSLAWLTRLVDIDSTVGAQINSSGELLVAGDSTVTLAAGSTIGVTLTTASVVSLDSSALTTGSKIRVETTAAWPQSSVSLDQTTAVISTASKIQADISTALPAGTNTIGAVYNVPDVSQVTAGTTAITVQYAAFGFATSGPQVIISSAANARIRVLAWNLVTKSTNTVTWFSDSTAGTTLAGPYDFAANGGISVGYSPVGWFQTSAGAGVDLVLKSEVASSVGGNVVYIQSSAI